MKELKSKKTGMVSRYSDEEYNMMVYSGKIDMKKYIITDIKDMKPIIPISREAPIEIKKIIKKK